MEHRGSLLRLQVPATSPYPEPDNPVHVSYPTSWKYVLSGLPIKTLYTPLLSPIHATWPAHLILLDLITKIIFGEQYRSLSSLYVVFSIPQLPRPSKAQMSFSAPCSQIPSAYTPPSTCERPSFTPMQNNDSTHSHIIIHTIHTIHIICIICKLDYAALPKDMVGYFVNSQYTVDKTL
jgi:hypothetical protein